MKKYIWLFIITLLAFGCSIVTDTSALIGPTQTPPAVLPQPAAASVVVDNVDAGFRIESGEWGTCERGECGGTCYATDFRYADTGCTECRARFTITAIDAGSYDVYAWWPQGDDRATDTPFTIQSSAGSVTIRVNQRGNGSDWYLLTRRAMQAGESLSITVGGTSTGYANADAIALTPAGSNPPAIVQAPQEPPSVEPVQIEPTPGTANQPAMPPVGTATQFRRVIFLHHSTGEALIAEGGVRERLTALGYEFYDHGYNEDGLTLANGERANMNYGIPDDNTDPDGYNVLFAQPIHSPPDNALSHLLQYDVIAFKSCFPVSDIQSDEQLDEYKTYYRNIRSVMDQHRDKIFIVVTPPPLVPAATEPPSATRARAFADWLGSSEYLDGHPNVFTFNFFNLLAEGNPGASDYDMLRAVYRADESDSHPNERANRDIGPQFVDFIDRAIRTYTGK